MGSLIGKAQAGPLRFDEAFRRVADSLKDSNEEGTFQISVKTLRKVSTVIAFQLYRAVEDWSASCPPGGRVPAWLEGRAYDPRFPVGDELWK